MTTSGIRRGDQADAHGPVGTAVPGRAARARDVLLSEWTKLRSIRSTYWALLVRGRRVPGRQPACSPSPPGAGQAAGPGRVQLHRLGGIPGAGRGHPRRPGVHLRIHYRSNPHDVHGRATATGGARGQGCGRRIAGPCLRRAARLGVVLAYPGDPVTARRGRVPVSPRGVRSGARRWLRPRCRRRHRCRARRGYPAHGGRDRGAAGRVLPAAHPAWLPSPWSHRIDRFTLPVAAYQVVALHPATDLLAPALSMLVLIAWPAIALAAAAVLITRQAA